MATFASHVLHHNKYNLVMFSLNFPECFQFQFELNWYNFLKQIITTTEDNDEKNHKIKAAFIIK